MEPYEFDDDPAPDFGPEPWLTDQVKETLEHLIQDMYEADCNTDHVEIRVSRLPGDNETLVTDYGTIKIVDAGTAE